MATQPHNRLRILFVDDERQLQEFMRIELKALGHDVVVCANGEQALQAIAAQSFDVALLDIRMPGLSGIDVLQRLKQVSPDTEAIMMTGYASEESMVQAMRLGACDYLRKPCQLAEIEASSCASRTRSGSRTRPSHSNHGSRRPRGRGS